MAEEPEAEPGGEAPEDRTAELDAFEAEAEGGPESEYVGPDQGEGEQAGADEQTRQVLRMGWGVLFNVAAVRLGPEWMLQEQEATDLADATADLLDNYFPEGVSLGPWSQFAFVLGVAVIPRAQQTAARQKAEAAAAEEAAAEGGEDAAA